MKSLNLVLFFSASFGALFLSGCATITRGTTEQLTIQSEPTGATVRLSNGFTGVTPAVFTVPRKGDVFVTASKEGYENAELALKSHISGKGTAGFLGNALIGGIIGGGVDVATGATLSHTPNPALIKLVAKIPPAVLPAAAPPVVPVAPVLPTEPAEAAQPPAAEPAQTTPAATVTTATPSSDTVVTPPAAAPIEQAPAVAPQEPAPSPVAEVSEPAKPI